MNTITIPIRFMNIEGMSKWLSNFEKEAVDICKKYNVEELWDNAVILKDKENLQVAIVSLGSYVKGSNAEKAVNEIVEAFESKFAN